MKELMIKKIPNHVSALKENGRFLHMQADNAAGPLFLQEVTKDHVGSSCTVFDINKFQYADNKLTLSAIISFPETCKSITLQANLIDDDTEKVICALDAKTVENSAELTYEYDGVPISANAGCEHAAVILYADWFDSAGAEGEAALFEDELKVKYKYDHKYPKKELNGYVTFGSGNSEIVRKLAEEYGANEGREESGNIIIALVREPDDTKDLDYLCKFGHIIKIQGVDYPPVSVPAHGVITLTTSGAKFLKNPQVTAVCSISKPGIGGARVMAVGLCDDSSYHTTDGEIDIKVAGDGSSITYDMTTAWKEPFLEGGSFALHEFDYDFSIRATIQYGESTLGHTFRISSSLPEEACMYQIPKITIKWGCLAEGTEILMANRKKRAIEKIQTGEHVRTDGGTAEVTNMWRGKEKECLLVRADNRRKLIITKSHPVLTKRGWKQAGELTCFDVLKTRSGWSAIRKIERVTKSINVFNPDTGGKIIYANGFVTGDFTLQNSDLGKE